MPFIKQKFYFQTPLKAYLFLMRELGLTMAQAQSYINKGRVVYAGEILGNNEKNKLLEKEVEVWVFKPHSIGLKPIYENADFALFNKPAKMLIHPKGRFSHHSLIDEVREACGEEAALIHRIDKETSGLVLVGKHKRSVVELGELFAKNQMKKKYLALVKGQMCGDSFVKEAGGVKDSSRGRIFGDFCFLLPISVQAKGGDLSVRSVFLGQDLGGRGDCEARGALGHDCKIGDSGFCDSKPHNSKLYDLKPCNFGFLNSKPYDSKFAKRLEFKETKSEFEILGDFKGNTLLKVYPITGRTHQIRVCLFALGFPILGDPLYGCEDWQSREYLESEFIGQNQDCGLCVEKRRGYFGDERLMLHAYSLEFFYKGVAYCFRTCEGFCL